jgi:carbon monoxide dehydrogenase subunit G
MRKPLDDRMLGDQNVIASPRDDGSLPFAVEGRTCGAPRIMESCCLAITGEYRIAAPREAVWAALNDAEVLKACIPGCEELQKLSETEIDARVAAALGPVRSTFATRIQLSDIKPPESYTISGEGKAAAGFGKGSAQVNLAEEGGATILRYSAELRLGGKLAQVGSRLLEGATRQLADQFFDAFAKRLDAGATKQEDAAADAGDGAATAGTSGGSKLPWFIAAAVVIAVIVWLLAV